MHVFKLVHLENIISSIIIIVKFAARFKNLLQYKGTANHARDFHCDS